MTAPAYLQIVSEARRRRPRVAMILGSGLGHLADRLSDTLELPYAQVPGLESPSIAGHRGVLMLGEWASQPVLIFAGRLHAYEGHSWDRVVQPVRIARELGAEILLVTNAAGGIRADLAPGDLMAIRDHVEWTLPDAWQHANLPRPSPYCPRLIELLQRAAHGLTLGVYAQVTGPSYETPAEIRALRAWGADAVGMSTAREVQTGHDFGMACAAVSCITNKAAGLSDGPINHEEVLATAAAQRTGIAELVDAFLRQVHAATCC